MLKTLSESRILLASTGAAGVILGANNRLTLSMSGSSSGPVWRLSGSPAPDAMSVQAFVATVTVGARYVMGAALRLGILTGDAGQVVSWLQEGVVGQNGDSFIRCGPFVTSHGVCLWLPSGMRSADYIVSGVVSYE